MVLFDCLLHGVHGYVTWPSGSHHFAPFVSPFASPSPFVFTSLLVSTAFGISTLPPGLSSTLAVKTSTPFSVTSNVCSNCAVRFPSAVTLVQSSGHVLSRYDPSVIIGSMVKHIPGAASPTALFFA